jgi:exopolysaccharide production protein ExoZ
MRTFLSLQILRAIAALSVVVCHSALSLNYWVGTDYAYGAALASAGVDLFFVISGFIITLVSWESFGSLAAVVPFAVRRLVRVGFLYWVVTTAYLAANSYPVDRVIQSYLLLPSERHLIPVAWTLVLELMFYAVVALALPLPRIAGLAFITAAITAVFLSGVHFYSSPIIFEFLFGVAVAVLYRQGVRIGASFGVGLVLIGLAAFGLLGTGLLGALGGLHDPLRWGLPAAAIVAGAVLAPELPRNRAILAAGAIGDASYALYLTHVLVTHIAGNVARLVPVSFPDSPTAVIAFFVLTAAAAVLLALVLFRFVEAPVLDMSKRLTTRSALPPRLSLPSFGASSAASAGTAPALAPPAQQTIRRRRAPWGFPLR